MNKEEAVDLIFDYLDTLKIMHSEPEEDDENNTEICSSQKAKTAPEALLNLLLHFPIIAFWQEPTIIQ